MPCAARRPRHGWERLAHINPVGTQFCWGGCLTKRGRMGERLLVGSHPDRHRGPRLAFRSRASGSLGFTMAEFEPNRHPRQGYGFSNAR